MESDAALKQSLFGHDGLGFLKAVTLGFDTPAFGLDAATTAYTSDESGNITEQRDAESRVSKFEFDALGRRTKRVLPSVAGQADRDEQYTRDAVGRMISKRKFDGQTITFEHDEVGRLLRKKLGEIVLAEFKYRVDGQRAWMKYRMPDGQYEEARYEYRGNRLWKKTTEAGTIEYDWDEAGNLKRLAAVTSNPSASHVVTYDWNARGQLEKVWANGATTPTGYKYDEVGNLKEMLYPNDLQTVYGYNAQQHLTDLTVTQNGADRATFNYNPSDRPLGLDGMRNAARETINGVTRNIDYFYDSLNRLTKETVNGSTIVYDGTPGYGDNGFDEVGRLLRKKLGEIVLAEHLTDVTVTQNGAARAFFNYNPSDRPLGLDGMRRAARDTINGVTRNVDYYYDPLNRLTNETVNGAVIAYDGAPGYADTQGFDKVGNRGQRVSGVNGVSNQTYAYDARDWISGATFDNNGNITGANDTTFEYDAEDRLIRRTGGELPEVKFAYDGDGNRIRKTVIDNGLTSVTHYLVDDRNPTGYAQTLVEKQGADPATSAVTKTFVWGHRLISQSLAGTTHYFLHDGHGNIRALINGATVTDTYNYDAFGIKLPSSTGSTENNYLYAGEHLDSQLNHYYLRARWYDPNTGRFWTGDSWEGNHSNPQSIHRYVYAHNNPLTGRDPSGHETLGSVMVGASIGATLSTLDTYIASGGQAKAKDLVTSFLLGGTIGAISGGIAPLFWEAGVGGRIFVSGIGISVGSWGVGDAFQEGNMELAVYRGATLGIGILSLAKGLPPRPTTTAIGNIGETRVAQMLKNNGYKDVLTLKNGSENGLDLFGITPDDRLAFFEVKTSTGGRPIGHLKPAQQDMNDYVLGILNEASRGTLRGQTISASDRALAKKLLSIYRADPSRVSGTLIGVDLQSNQIHVSPWPGRPEGN